MSTSLGRLLAWNQILPLLGVNVRETVLPAVVHCPLCQGKRGYVYRDPVLEGQWFYCHDCRAAGDMIELAAAAWKLGPLNTLRKAKEMGINLPEANLVAGATDSYVKYRLGPRARARKFWREAKDYFVSSGSPSLRRLQHFLGVQEHLTPSWQYHGAAFIGAADARVVRGLYDSSAGPEQRHVRSLLRGPGWEDVIVLPFWDLPGRLCGFLFIGRQGRADEDIVYHYAPEFMLEKRGRRRRLEKVLCEAGVTMPAAAFRQQKRHDLFGNAMFVMDDPVLAVRLQIRYMRDTTIPLSLVATYDQMPYRTRKVWDWLPTEEVVFWSLKQSASMLRQAKEADAYVSTASVGMSSQEANLRTDTPEGWFKIVRREKIPWQEALRQRLRKATPAQAEELLLELEITGGELREFIATCDTKLAGRLQRIHDGRTAVRTVAYGNHVITEDEDGWSVSPAPATTTTGYRAESQRICDVVVRIEHILRTGDNRSYYQGIVLFRGDTIPFTEKVETLDKDMWAWLKSILALHGLGVPTSLGQWHRRLMDISLRFCQPDVIWGADVVGWDAERHQFNFPKFAIALGGEVVNDYICLFTDPNVPGRDLIRPESLGQIALRVLSEHNEETQIFWAMAVCVTNNVLALALNSVPRGILLDGIGAQAIGAAAAVRLGCNEFDIGAPTALRQALSHHGSHHWPMLFRFTKPVDLNVLDAWLSTGVTHQVILKLPTSTVNVLGVRQKWNIITCHRKLGSMQLVNDAAPRVLPAYLKDLCERRLWVPRKHNNETDNVLDDMANWFHRRGGDPLAVLRARAILRVPGRPNADVHFMELIRHLIREGRLASVRDGFDSGSGKMPKVISSSEQGQIWIPQRSVIDLVEAVASIPLDLLPVTHALDQCGCLLGEVELDRKMNWAVDAEWFDKRWGELEAQHTE